MIYGHQCLLKLKLVLFTSHQHRIRVWLRSMDLYNFAKHPRARALSCQFSSPISDNTVIVCVNFFVCGTKSVVSLQLSGGRFKQLILDWLNCDVCVSSTYTIYFTFSSSSSSVSMIRKSIFSMRRICLGSVPGPALLAQVFTMSRRWHPSPLFESLVYLVKLPPNSSPRSDISQFSDAVFYAGDGEIVTGTTWEMFEEIEGPGFCFDNGRKGGRLHSVRVNSDTKDLVWHRFIHMCYGKHMTWIEL